MRRPTARRLGVAATALVVSTVLAACGSDGSDGSDGSGEADGSAGSEASISASFAPVWTEGLVPVIGQLAGYSDFDVENLNSTLPVADGWTFVEPSDPDGLWCLESEGRSATGTATTDKFGIFYNDVPCSEVDPAASPVGTLYDPQTRTFSIIKGSDDELAAALVDQPGL